jgi:hypothetical protein
MHETRIVLGAAFAALLGIGVNTPATAETAHPGPVLLTDSEMDRITAGTALDFIGSALASGNFILTETSAGGAESTTSLPGGGSVQSGVIIGISTAFAPGGTASANASTSASVTGPTIVYMSASGGASYPGVQTAISVTFVSGGPTFLP